jgi:phospholipid transport system transporter-binding protein
MAGEAQRPACRLEQQDPGHWRVSGELDLETAAGMLSAGTAAFAGVPRAEVDLSGVTDADSAGLAVLIEWVRGACASGRSISFRGLPPRLAELARIGGVADLLPVAD